MTKEKYREETLFGHYILPAEMSAAKKAKLDPLATHEKCDEAAANGRLNGNVAKYPKTCNGSDDKREPCSATSSTLNGTNLSKDAIMEMRRKIIG